MAHPDDHALAGGAARLVHRPVSFVVDPLRPRGELLQALRLSEGLFHHRVESRGALGALQGIIVHPPDIVLRPAVLLTQHPLQALEGRHVRHPPLAVQGPGALRQREILLHRQGAVRAVAADRAFGGMRDVVQARMQALHQRGEARVERSGRIAFVAPAVQRQAGMMADLAQIVFGVRQEHRFVVRLGPVGGIGQPEVLPHHHAVAVTGLPKCLVAGLPHPVAYQGEMHVGVVRHGDVELAGAVVEIQFREAPVAPVADEAPPVDIDVQGAVFDRIRHLPYARPLMLLVADIPVHADARLNFVQMRFAIACRPPEFGLLQPGGRQGDIAGLSCSELGFALDQQLSVTEGNRGLAGLCAVVGERNDGPKFCVIRRGQREVGVDEHVVDRDAARMGGQENVVPDADVAPAHGRDPVPTDGAVHRGVVGPEHAAIKVRALAVLLLDDARVVILEYLDR